MYRIINGKIVLENSVLDGYDLIIKNDKIFKITNRPRDYKYKIIDAKGGYVTPGFIDIHADYIEHMAAPRPSSLMDFKIAIHEAERELISHGITTMYHSLSLYKPKSKGIKPIREPANVKKFVELISKVKNEQRQIHHRLHLRYEIDNIEGFESVKEYAEKNKVDLLSIMDHSPGQGQYRNLIRYKKMLKSYGRIETEEEADKIIMERQNSEKASLTMLKKLAEVAKSNNIPMASHDDDTIEKLKTVKDLGAKISEFPITLEVAKKAKELGFYTVAGAPNVLLGRSTSGNLSAIDGIKSNCIDILSSDYYPAGMLHAVYKLFKILGYELHEAMRLVTINPAKAIGIDKSTGSIQEGKIADILIINELDDGMPAITSAFVAGNYLFSSFYRGIKNGAN